MGSSFFNTLNFSGTELERENARAMRQEELVLAIFKANPTKEISPTQLHEAFVKKYHLNPPLTSIRRSLTNLTGRLEIIKTENMVKGNYHLPQHTWKYAGTIENIYKSKEKSAGDIASNIISKTQGSLF